MRGDRISFSHILPVIDLALLVVLVFVPITMTALHLCAASKGAAQVRVPYGGLDLTVPRDQIVPAAIRIVTVPKARIMMAINLPGALVQKLISLSSRTSLPEGWYPQALALETWQALVFPFFALPFWWLVGCGLDALIRKERLHWSFLLAGTLLCGINLASFSRLFFPMAAADRVDLALWMRSIAGWTIAFAVLPIAWILQSIRERHLRNSEFAP